MKNNKKQTAQQYLLKTYFHIPTNIIYRLLATVANFYKKFLAKLCEKTSKTFKLFHIAGKYALKSPSF